MEDLIADIALQLQELQSSIIVLKQAVGNDFEETEKEDIYNYLEILTEKIATIINQYKKIDILTDELKISEAGQA